MSSPIYYVSVRKLPGGNSSMNDIIYAELKDCACNHSLMDIDTLKLFIKTTQKRLGELEREHPRTRKRRLREYIDVEDSGSLTTPPPMEKTINRVFL